MNEQRRSLKFTIKLGKTSSVLKTCNANESTKRVVDHDEFKKNKGFMEQQGLNKKKREIHIDGAQRFWDNFKRSYFCNYPVFADQELLTVKKKIEEKEEETSRRLTQVCVLPMEILVPKRKRSSNPFMVAVQGLLLLCGKPLSFSTKRTSLSTVVDDDEFLPQGVEEKEEDRLTSVVDGCFAATENKDCCKKIMRGKGKKRSHDDDDDDDETKEKKKKKKLRKVNYNKKKMMDATAIPDLPPQLRTYVDGLLGASALLTPPVFVIQKALTKTDLSIGHNRLSMPASSINKEFLESFLTDDEKAMLQQDNRQHIGVRLVDPNLREYTALNFTRWTMNASSIYVLVTDWNNVWNDNRLKEGMLVQLWSFRVHPNTISFALAVQRG